MKVITEDTKKEIDIIDGTDLFEKINAGTIIVLGANELEGRPTMTYWENMKDKDKYVEDKKKPKQETPDNLPLLAGVEYDG